MCSSDLLLSCRVIGRTVETAMLAHLCEHGACPGEDITDAAIAAGIVPDELRAFGAVFMSLSRSGKIIKAGTCQRRKGHGSAGGHVWAIKEDTGK